jgi:hypothetical protein
MRLLTAGANRRTESGWESAAATARELRAALSSGMTGAKSATLMPWFYTLFESRLYLTLELCQQFLHSLRLLSKSIRAQKGHKGGSKMLYNLFVRMAIFYLHSDGVSNAGVTALLHER